MRRFCPSLVEGWTSRLCFPLIGVDFFEPRLALADNLVYLVLLLRKGPYYGI